MKKNLLLTSLFLFNICLTNEEIATTETTQTQTEFIPTSFVLDFTVEPTSINDTWLNMIQKTQELTNAFEQYNENPETAPLNVIEETLQLTKTLHDLALDDNNLLGCLKAYDTNADTTAMENESNNQNSIIIRFSLTKINDQNPELWQTVQSNSNVFIQTLENGETEYPYETICNFVHELENLVQADQGMSLAKNINISVYSEKTSDNTKEMACDLIANQEVVTA